MKKLLLMLATLFTLTISASDPLRFTRVQVSDTGILTYIITIAGGVPPYTFKLDAATQSGLPGPIAVFITPIPASGTTVSFLVTDSNLDVIAGTVLLLYTTPHTFAASADFTYTHPTCNSSADGSIAMLKSASDGNFEIDGVVPVSCPPPTTTCNPTGLSSGMIECTAENLFALLSPLDSFDFIVTTPFVPIDSTTITSAVPTLPTCPGDTDGSITVTATTTSGPMTPLEYTLEPGSLEINSNTGSATFTNLAPDTYMVTVLDTATGCSDTADVDVTAVDAIVFSPDSTNPTCRNQQNGTIALPEGNIIGGTSPYTYSIGEEFISTDDTFDDLKPDTYTVTVMDFNGCLSAPDMVIISKADRIKINDVIVVDCTMPVFGNGQITILAESDTDLWYSIDDGANFQNMNFFDKLALGKYKIIVNKVNDTESKCASRTVHIRSAPEE